MRWSAIFSDPLTIERVDVPVRLEKRLAALLHDLAAHHYDCHASYRFVEG